MTYEPLLISGLAERSDFCLKTEIRRRLLYTKTICSPFVHVATGQSGAQILPCLARGMPKLGTIGQKRLLCELRGLGRRLVRRFGEKAFAFYTLLRPGPVPPWLPSLLSWPGAGHLPHPELRAGITITTSYIVHNCTSVVHVHNAGYRPATVFCLPRTPPLGGTGSPNYQERPYRAPGFSPLLPPCPIKGRPPFAPLLHPGATASHGAPGPMTPLDI